jgi:DNA-binding CsgD family transcriptional regulator
MEDRALAERVKELSCLYALSQLYSRDTLAVGSVLAEMVKIIRPAWQYPHHTGVLICLEGLTRQSDNYRPARRKLVEQIRIRNATAGFVEVVWLGGETEEGAEVFLPEERQLLAAIARLFGGVLEKRAARAGLKQTALALKKKNLALQEIISHIGGEKDSLTQQFLASIELTVLPVLAKLKNPDLPPAQRGEYLAILEKNLQEITSPYARRLAGGREKLSPRETEICTLIRNGLNNKEIARLLMISLLTVARHRHNIRRKLELVGKEINLATYLHDL